MNRVFAVCMLLAVLHVPALSAAGVLISRSVVAGGGGPCADQALILQGTVGQPVMGALTGSSLVHGVGFWCEWLWLPAGLADPLAQLPATYSLGPCVPNPFHPTATIRYALPRSTQVTIGIYDVSGRLVRKLVDETIAAGYHQALLDGQGLPGGVYFCRMKAGAFKENRTFVHIK